MAQHLALVACCLPHEGPWLRVRGDSGVLRVVGDEVRLDVEAEAIAYSFIVKPGLTPIKTKGWKRYRAVKEISGNPTTVRLLED